MKKRTRAYTDDSLLTDDPVLDISSLIDVCFLLLIFFLVTTTIQPRERDLQMPVPSRGVGSPMAHIPMLIELRSGGEVVINPGDAAEFVERDVSSRELPELKSRLGMFTGLGADHCPKVILRVDDEVGQQRYIDVLNCLAGSGVRSIALLD